MHIGVKTSFGLSYSSFFLLPALQKSFYQECFVLLMSPEPYFLKTSGTCFQYEERPFSQQTFRLIAQLKH